MTANYVSDRFPGPDPYAPLADVPSFDIASEDIVDGERLADTLAGDNATSPQLSWSGAPEGTKTYAVTCFDPDAPVPSGFWHWTVSNIPANVTSIDTGADAPAGALTHRNDAGVAGFLGAAPPAGHGPHRYIFCVTAVDVEKLDIDENASPAVVNFNLLGHGLGRAFLTVTYAEPAA